MIDEAERVLGWWVMGCIASADVVEWADRTIEMAESGRHLPSWLLDLSLLGPQAFVNRAYDGDPRPRDFEFKEAFRAMVEATDPADEAAVDRFTRWVARSALAEDLSLDEVRAGYEIDDLLDHDRAAAKARALELLLAYASSCNSIVEALPWWRSRSSEQTDETAS